MSTGRTTHVVSDMTYVVDHDTKEVFLEEKVKVANGEEKKGDLKLRKTGGDYEQFLAKLPAEEPTPVVAEPKKKVAF